MHEFLKVILSYKGVVFVGALMFTFVVTQILKLPIKKFTKKIENDATRRLVNLVILLIPFLLGCLYEYLYSYYYLHEAFSILRGLSFGASGISAYNLAEPVFKKIFGVKTTTNVYKDTESGKAVVELINDITKDGKVDKNDLSAVDSFLNDYDADEETSKVVKEFLDNYDK